jgi:type II secretory pathway component PulF
MRVWKKLSALISNGMVLEDSLVVLQRQSARRRSFAASIFSNILDHIASGRSLGIALAGYATPAEIMLISSGQASNRLAETLQLSAELLEARKKVVAAVTGALAYPVFLTFLSFVVLFVVAVVLIPELSGISDPTRWSGMAAALYAISTFVTSPWGLVIFLILCGLVFVSLSTMSIWTGSLRLYADKIPPWSIYRLTVGCVWLFTLTTLMRSGMQLGRVLENMLDSKNTTPYLRERVQAILEHSRSGRNFGTAMDECGMNFPDIEIVDDIRVYSMALSTFNERLYDIAKQSMADGVDKIQRNARVLNAVCMMLIIVQIICVVVSISSLQQQILGGF